MKLLYLALILAICPALSAQEYPPEQAGPRQETSDFTLYPNPAFDDVVYITTRHNEHKEITVYDVFGKVVLRDRISTNTLNISRLVPGVYVLQVAERNKTMTRKLVVK
jgi:hypothetical protein